MEITKQFRIDVPERFRDGYESDSLVLPLKATRQKIWSTYVVFHPKLPSTRLHRCIRTQLHLPLEVKTRINSISYFGGRYISIHCICNANNVRRTARVFLSLSENLGCAGFNTERTDLIGASLRPIYSNQDVR